MPILGKSGWNAHICYRMKDICSLPAFFICLFGVAPAHADEPEEATYDPILRHCYESAEPSDLSGCIGRMADACKDGEEGGWSTLGISQCNLAEARVWDGYLNSVYQETLAAFEASDADEAEQFPEFARRVEALRDAQRAWIMFRDSECGLAYAVWGAGSMRNIASSACQMQMTAERVIDLRRLTETR